MSPADDDLKAAFEAQFGYWTQGQELLLAADPAFLETYIEFAGRPFESDALDPKMKALVHLTTNVNATHLHEPAVERSLKRALDAGATTEEIVQTLELNAAIGIHGLIEGVPILVDEAGRPTDVPAAERAEKEEVKQAFIDRRGYWGEIWDDVLDLDHEFFGGYTDFSAYPYERGPLTAKEKEFLYIAFDTSTTHLYHPGLRVHIQNALDCGATRQEIMEVIEHTCTIGMQSIEVGLPLLADILDERGESLDLD
jgi:alkylhydroperoxidase/carboxymuconolactone decarboxylase family protein YurZ